MKVSQLPYERVTIEYIRSAIESIFADIKSAASADDVLAARKRYVDLTTEIETMLSLAYCRHTLDTRDQFYTDEQNYYDEITPELTQIITEYGRLMLESPFRAELEQRLSPVLFKSFEVAQKAMSPEIIEDMIEENRLTTEYSNFMSQLMFEFRGEKMPRTLLSRFFQDDDRDTRREAYEAMGRGFEENAETLDSLFDRLVKVRDRMAKRMGYKNFVELGYYRMGRLCYDKDMVAGYRKNILSDIVPVVARLKARVAERLGIDRIMMYDDSVVVAGGNPRPVLDTAGIFAEAREMYHSMSPQTAAFIDMMLENEAFDVESREGKWGGGYCTSFAKYKQPFILANFNGTAGDIDVITHEAGHAFADFMTCDNELRELGIGGMETAETHSMSMEFFCWRYMDRFFGDKAQQYRYMHALDGLSFLPYGTMVDYFQHIVYENPEMTPAERNAAWKKLEQEFKPYMSTEGMTYLEKGTRWQYQMHIYESPFYYIDYCLAQVIAFQFLLASLDDYDDAFARYYRYLCHGGELVFTDLVAEAGLASPFKEGALKNLAEGVEKLILSLE
ncbi:MAG: M3 family oligoendopeptidase [Ruminococcaceae bacterium]|nr:M3 family oligoendopeptidase [Oscillospiraceae bacterium]